MGYPSREVLAAWIDELAPGERAVKRGPVADEVRRMAVARLVAGRRHVAAGRGRGGRGGVGREKPGSVNCCTSRYRRTIQ